jgi:hypothetical protein
MLSRDHNYYYQIQGQMAFCNARYCNFFVYTSRGYYLERVAFDTRLWQDMLEELRNFWITFVAPYILSPQVQHVSEAKSVQDAKHSSEVSEIINATNTSVSCSSIDEVGSKKRRSTGKKSVGQPKRKLCRFSLNSCSGKATPRVYLCAACGTDTRNSSANVTAFSIECEDCHVWYHLGCLGIKDTSKIPADFHHFKCFTCAILT